MKSYSLVRKLGSCIGFTTLTLGLFSSLGSKCAFANEELLKNKLFLVLLEAVTEKDVKNYNVDAFWNEQVKDAGQNVERLKVKSLWTLVKLWKFSNDNTDEKIQKIDSRRELAQNFKKDVEKILKVKIEKLKLIPADVADIAAVLKASKYEDIFFNENNIFVKENFCKYSPIVKEIHDGYFDDNKTPQIKVMFRFVKVCELINNILIDGMYVKKLDKVELHRALVNLGCFSKDLVSSGFCSPKELIEIFSIFSKMLPGFRDLKKSVEEMEKSFAEGKFSEFVKAYQEGARAAYKEKDTRTTADLLNEAFKEQLNELSSIFSDKDSLEGLLNFQYGNIFSNINMFSSGKEGGFFTAHVRK